MVFVAGSVRRGRRGTVRGAAHGEGWQGRSGVEQVFWPGLLVESVSCSRLVVVVHCRPVNVASRACCHPLFFGAWSGLGWQCFLARGVGWVGSLRVRACEGSRADMRVEFFSGYPPWARRFSPGAVTSGGHECEGAQLFGVFGLRGSQQGGCQVRPLQLAGQARGLFKNSPVLTSGCARWGTVHLRTQVAVCRCLEGAFVPLGTQPSGCPVGLSAMLTLRCFGQRVASL